MPARSHTLPLLKGLLGSWSQRTTQNVLCLLPFHIPPLSGGLWSAVKDWMSPEAWTPFSLLFRYRTSLPADKREDLSLQDWQPSPFQPQCAHGTVAGRLGPPDVDTAPQLCCLGRVSRERERQQLGQKAAAKEMPTPSNTARTALLQS